MKKIALCFSLFLYTAFSHAQNGLECVDVEIYYISDVADTVANADGGVLPVGSVTYRVYADMLPGYKFQAGYGVNTPGASHECRIETTTLFFNNEDRGATKPTYSKTQAEDNTVMLDSWLSVGAACAGHFGIMKIYDDSSGTVNNSYSPQVLQNDDSLAGIPLTLQDGIIYDSTRSPEPVTDIGISPQIDVFNDQNDGSNGPSFVTDNGSWASLNGSIGPDSIDNKVLIMQITTDGVFSFELNIQIGTSTGGVENYVAKNPVGNEIQLACLTYNSLAALVADLNSTNQLFNVYPNPAQNTIALEVISSKKTSINSYTIYSEDGRVVLHKKNWKVYEGYVENVDLSSLAAGQYFIQLSMDGITSTKKIIKN